MMSNRLADIHETTSFHDSIDGSRNSDNSGGRRGSDFAARSQRSFKRQGSNGGTLFQRRPSGSLSSPTTMNRISNVPCIETGSDVSGKEHFAQIRRGSDCRPMGRVDRRNRHLRRLVNATRNMFNLEIPTLAASTSQNGTTHSDMPPEQEEGESVLLSHHGRLSVRASSRTVSVPNLMLPPVDDSSQRENDDLNEDTSGKSYAEEAEAAALAMMGGEGIITVPLKGGGGDEIVRTPQKGSLLEKPQEEPAYHLETTTQYRLNGTKPSNTMASRVLGMIGISTSNRGIYDDAGSDEDGCSCWGVNPNNMVTSYLHWTFRQSFLAVFFSAALGFFGFTIVFAILILWSGKNRPECLHVNGESFSNYTGATGYQDFGDAYALSWTSFSTVGYGLVYPSTSAQHPKQNDCAGIFILCCFESFVGILFASFCGAVMFAKVGRIRSHAQVMFSDAIVIRYGTGVLAEMKEDDNDASGSYDSDEEDGGAVARHVNHNEYPCPVLEFRIANRLHGTNGGEIMDCSMNIVASIDESQASHTLRKAANATRRRKGKRIKRRQKRKPKGLPKANEEAEAASHDALNSLALHLREHAKKQSPQAFEEDPSGKIVPKRIFSKLEVETPDHPFFKRVWTARHTLDLESPILAEEAKQMIRLNRGFWPSELNDPESVRASINLDQILVSLSGTSNADANSVYSQKIYDHHDMNIGYRFVNMMYRDPRDGSLKVDTSVINDVVEQAGGGGEALNVEDIGIMGEILVL